MRQIMRNGAGHFAKVVAGVVAGVVAFAAAEVHAAKIFDFSPDPISDTIPELTWGGSGPTPALGVAPGSVGNSDGNLPESLQTSGGLRISTIFNIPSLLIGGSVNATNGQTTFYDATLVLTGLSASAVATNNDGAISQRVTGGTVQFLSTDPDGPLLPQQPVVLLTGSLSNGRITGEQFSNIASVFSSTVTYTGGLIYSALISAGYSANGGQMSVSLIDVNPTVDVDASGPFAGYLSPFTANAIGQFSAVGPTTPVPEPVSLGLAALGATALLGRRRR